MRVTLPATEFALATLFERVPDARVECKSVVAAADDHALVVVRADADERSVSAALQADSAVRTVDKFCDRTDGWTYRVTWKGRPRRLIQQLVAADITLLSAQGRGGRWKFHLLAPDREGISRAYEIMTEFGCEPDCLSISSVDGEQSNQCELTDVQRETLVEAFDAGYYEVPRNATAKELAEVLDISHQALSERLRRAASNLIKIQIIID